MTSRFRPSDLTTRVFLPNPTTHYSDIDWNDFDAVVHHYALRIEQWYLEPTRALARNDNFGFAVLAMTCILIDTLSQYESGEEESSSKAFKEYVRRRLKGFKPMLKPPIDDVRDLADALWDGFRCGILHEGHLKLYCGVAPNAHELIRVEAGHTELFDGTPCNTVILDPIALFGQVEKAFGELIKDLKKASNSNLRARFKKKFESSFGVEIAPP